MGSEIGWGQGGQGTHVIPLSLSPTAPPLAGGAPAGGTGGLLVSAQGVSWGCGSALSVVDVGGYLLPLRCLYIHHSFIHTLRG